LRSLSANLRKVRAIAPRVFKRSLFGYRRQDVDEAIVWRDMALQDETKRANAEMARADLLTARINDEARRANAAVKRAAELERASLDLAGKVNELEQVADRLALRVVERERAIVKLTERLDETLALLRDTEDGGSQPVPAIEKVAATNGAAATGAPKVDEAAAIFAGLIEVEVGPLSDFEQLASFEDAASEIGATEGILVKRFAQGRATLEMNLAEPVALLSELESRAPFEFTVRDTREDKVVLDVDSD
jgi:hypothetical protein